MEEIQLTRKQKFMRFINECARVVKVTKKPDRAEFSAIVKVSALGMAVIGFIGFTLHIIKELWIR